mgnify:CR=1 FL=1
MLWRAASSVIIGGEGGLEVHSPCPFDGCKQKGKEGASVIDACGWRCVVGDALSFSARKPLGVHSLKWLNG